MAANTREIPSKLIKSKSRVRDLGEVYTNKREVTSMLDLIPDIESKTYAEATFMEPACGNGNFLIEILRRKLQSVDSLKDYFEVNGCIPKLLPLKGKADEIIAHAAQILASVYGFDICANNVAETRARLWSYIVYGIDTLPKFITGSDFETLKYIEAVTPDHVLPLAADYEGNLAHYAAEISDNYGLRGRAAVVGPMMQSALKLILAKNIQQGDFLAQTDSNGNALVVCEWEFFAGGKFLRESFKLGDLSEEKPKAINSWKLSNWASFVKEETHA